MLGPNLIDWKSPKQTLVEWKLALRKEMTNKSDPAALLTDCQSGIKKLKGGEQGPHETFGPSSKKCCRSHGT